MVKNLPAKRETPVQYLSQEDPLEKQMATHSSILAWIIHGQRRMAVHGVTELDMTSTIVHACYIKNRTDTL